MCRSYQDRPVPRSILLRILDSANKSPSAGHSQGVRFVVITNKKKRLEIAKIHGEERYVERGYKAWLSSAPVHILVAVRKADYDERYSEPDKNCSPQDWPVSYPILDTGKALMALYLAAENFSLACGYLGPHAGPDLLSALNLPSDWTHCGLVSLGYPDRVSQKLTHSQKRGWKAFDDIVTWIS